MIIADIMAFALDVPAPARIVLISGDRDFAYPLSLIRGRGYQVVLITPPVGAVPILEASANHVARWRQDVLGLDRDGNGRLYPSTPTKPLPRSSSPGPFGKSTPSKPPSTPKAMQLNPSESSTPSTTMLSGPGAGPVPRVFVPLVQALEECAREGQVRPLRSKVALRLTAIDRDVYEKAGASSWRDYSEVAVAAGIVVLGGTGVSGHEWIALRTLDSNHFQVQPAAPTPSKKQPGTPADGQLKAFPVTPDVGTPTKKQPPTAPASFRTPQRASEAEFEKVSATDSTHGPPEQFEPLFNAVVLAEQACRRSPPIASVVGAQLNAAIENGLPSPYEAAGVRTWGTYITAAFKARVAKLTPSEREGVAALAINPAYEPYVQKLRTSLPFGEPWVPPQIEPQAPGSSQDTPTSSPQRPSSPSKKAASILPSIFRKKSSDGTPNSKKTAYDAGPELKLPHSPSGTIIKVTYFPLANVLLHERRGGQYYCTDTHLHSVVSKHKHMGSKLKTFDAFSQYLEAAESEGVCTIEAGFKPGTRHVRLADRLRDPNENRDLHQKESLPPAGADPTEPMLFPGPDAGTRKRTESALSAATSKGKEKAVEGTGAIAAPGKLNGSTSSTESEVAGAGAAPGSMTATEADRRRFKPLMDVMFWFAKQSPAELRPRRSIVYGMLLDRWSPGGSLQPWLEEHGASSIGDYTRQAEKFGFILCERDTKPDGTQGSKLLRLAPKYARQVSNSGAAHQDEA